MYNKTWSQLRNWNKKVESDDYAKGIFVGLAIAGLAWIYFASVSLI